jgi:hypothetical protein
MSKTAAIGFFHRHAIGKLVAATALLIYAISRV